MPVARNNTYIQIKKNIQPCSYFNDKTVHKCMNTKKTSTSIKLEGFVFCKQSKFMSVNLWADVVYGIVYTQVYNNIFAMKQHGCAFDEDTLHVYWNFVTNSPNFTQWPYMYIASMHSRCMYKATALYSVLNLWTLNQLSTQARDIHLQYTLS